MTNSSFVMANAAGMESTAKAMSAATTAARQTNRGVAARLPLCSASSSTNHLLAWYSLVTGKKRRTARTAKFLSGSTFSATPLRIR
jgi:hypothetical protein